MVAGTGVVLGLAASIALLHLLESFVFGVTFRDPVTLIAVSGLLMFLAVAACWLPARRASLVDPVVALNGD